MLEVFHEEYITTSLSKKNKQTPFHQSRVRTVMWQSLRFLIER